MKKTRFLTFIKVFLQCLLHQWHLRINTKKTSNSKYVASHHSAIVISISTAQMQRTQKLLNEFST